MTKQQIKIRLSKKLIRINELNNLYDLCVEKKYTRFLSRNEKQIFLLKYIDDLTIHEIAQTLNKNENTVKTHLYRSIKKIKKHRETII